MKAPAPPRVDNSLDSRYYTELPAEQSARCTYWVKKIAAGWRPNKRINKLGYSEAAQYFGVYVSEYINVIAWALRELDESPPGDGEEMLK